MICLEGRSSLYGTYRRLDGGIWIFVLILFSMYGLFFPLRALYSHWLLLGIVCLYLSILDILADQRRPHAGLTVFQRRISMKNIYFRLVNYYLTLLFPRYKREFSDTLEGVSAHVSDKVLPTIKKGVFYHVRGSFPTRYERLFSPKETLKNASWVSAFGQEETLRQITNCSM